MALQLAAAGLGTDSILPVEAVVVGQDSKRHLADVEVGRAVAGQGDRQGQKRPKECLGSRCPAFVGVEADLADNHSLVDTVRKEEVVAHTLAVADKQVACQGRGHNFVVKIAVD